MSEGSASTGQHTQHKKFAGKYRPHNAAPFDRQRAAEQLTRFLDLALREINLATRYEISGAADSNRGATETASDNIGNVAMEREARSGGQDADIVVRFSGDDEDILLSRNGELLLALEYLAHRWLRLEPALHDRVRFDCGDYRETRLEELKLSARVAAQRVRETGQPFPFNPMSSRDRRIIHLELNGAPGVRTISEGSGDRRHLVIYPAGKK
jgi:spoIIIJ-associated protein